MTYGQTPRCGVLFFFLLAAAKAPGTLDLSSFLQSSRRKMPRAPLFLFFFPPQLRAVNRRCRPPPPPLFLFFREMPVCGWWTTSFFPLLSFFTRWPTTSDGACFMVFLSAVGGFFLPPGVKRGCPSFFVSQPALAHPFFPSSMTRSRQP